MVEHLAAHVTNKLNSSSIIDEPFPFLYIKDFFSESFYERLNTIYPPESQFTSLNDKKIKPLSFPHDDRFSVVIYNRESGYSELDGYKFADEAVQFRRFCRDFLIPIIAKKLNVAMPGKWDDDTRFILDKQGYKKHPHTDHPGKIFSILIYMSHSSNGTTILKPKKEGYIDSYGYDHKYGEFNEVYDLPFVPNSMLAFERTDRSFHCVKITRPGEIRRAIHITARR